MIQRRKTAGALLTLSLLGSLATPPANADCQQHLNQAKTLLQTYKQQAAEKRMADPQGAANRVKVHIDAMVQEGCVNEVLSLYQYIQAEQSRLDTAPAPGR